MGNLKKKSKNLNTCKQLTLDSLSTGVPNKTNIPINLKQIAITGIDTTSREDELVLKTSFELIPSKTAFSKVKLDLWFDDQQISSISISIPQGPLTADEFELKPVLDMKGIPAGIHTIKLEMYELWSSGEKLSPVTKEILFEYQPQTRESRLIKVPIVKSVAGADLIVATESEKEIYKQIEETAKKELKCKRDQW
jgi:hypothetical protein